MEPLFLETLHKEKSRLEALVTNIDELIRLFESSQPVTPEEVLQLLTPPKGFDADEGFPYFGSQFEKIGFVIKKGGRLCRKEMIIEGLKEYEKGQNPQTVATILSRKVKKGQAVSLKYNGSNLYVFYGLPSFFEFPEGQVKAGFEPHPSELANILVKQVTVSCGGEEIDLPVDGQ